MRTKEDFSLSEGLGSWLSVALKKATGKEEKKEVAPTVTTPSTTYYVSPTAPAAEPTTIPWGIIMPVGVGVLLLGAFIVMRKK